MEKFEIKRIKGDEVEMVEDYVAREVPFTVFVGGKEMVTLLCSPSDLKDLVKGFIFTSGLVKSLEDIKKVILDEQQWTAYVDLVDDSHLEELVFKRMYTSGCGKGTLFYNALDVLNRSSIDSNFTIKNTQISYLVGVFQKSSELYLKTGGIHSAAIADRDNIKFFREDIGRHNAIDKVIGAALAKKNDFENSILITSGRVSSEVIFKVRKCNIPMIISKSAPTNQTVRHAREMKITLVGFARGNRMNIYSQSERVVI